MLSDSKANLHFCTSGEEALKKVALEDYTLIILDVVMPDLGGFEVAESIMQNPNLKNTPIIFISGIKDSEDALYRGYQVGAVDFLFKPLNAYILKSKVNIFLSLHEKQRKLEKMVELEREKKELVRSNKDLVQFANIASHDLRSPLNRVMSFAHVLLENETICKDLQAKVCAQKIKDSSERMDQLIKGILNYAQTDQNEVKMKVQNLNTIIEDVMSDLEVAITQSDAIFEVEELPEIPGHEILLRQLFQNLISNCIKFKHPKRAPLIRIEKTEYSNEQQLCIAIRDNGLGFNVDQADEMFKPFKRLENTKNIEGNGLGLATVQRILDIHKAKIQLESIEGQGSSFIMTFPTSFTEFAQKRIETRNQIENKPIELFCLQNTSQSYQMVIVDESETGFGGKIIGYHDLHVGKILNFNDQTYKVCWILEFSQNAYRLGLQKVTKQEV